MLFTGKGDKGTTKTYGCDQRISKSSAVAEALGSLDEVNSFLGVVKMGSTELGFVVAGQSFAHIVHEAQQGLFMVQAEVAGFPMQMTSERVKAMEAVINAAEGMMPPIKTFFISGGTDLGAAFDFARTLARRAERRVVAVAEEGVGAAPVSSPVPGSTVSADSSQKIGAETLAYLNRLSSLLYALARLSNHLSGIPEEAPKYK